VSGGAFGAQRGEPPLDLGSDQRGVGQQLLDFAPHERIEFVGADRPVGAHAPADVAVVVRADAAVVVDQALGGARRGAPARVAAVTADDDALQQRRFSAVALGAVLVLFKTRLGEFERLVGDQRPGRGCGSTARARHRVWFRGGRGAHRERGPGAWASRAGRWSASCRTRPVRGRRGCAASPTPSSDPHVLAGAGQNAILRQRTGDVRDRLTTLGVAVKDLAHDLRLALGDLSR
jgi:hypothetical protein